MKVIIITFPSGKKTAYPYNLNTLHVISRQLSIVEDIEIIDYDNEVNENKENSIVLSDDNNKFELTEKLNGFLKRNNLKIELPLMGTKLVNFEYSR
tara:strand:+ start:1067 stop:1354 length:288 start_codon:yes stop_codon:yes gene_type:complete